MAVVATSEAKFGLFKDVRRYKDNHLFLLGHYYGVTSSVGDATGGTVANTLTFPDLPPTKPQDYWLTIEQISARHSTGAGGYVCTLQIATQYFDWLNGHNFYYAVDAETNDGLYTHAKMSAYVGSLMGKPIIHRFEKDPTSLSKITWKWGTNTNTETYDLWAFGYILVEGVDQWLSLVKPSK